MATYKTPKKAQRSFKRVPKNATAQLITTDNDRKRLIRQNNINTTNKRSLNLNRLNELYAEVNKR